MFLLTSSSLVLIRDWRISIMTVLFQYLTMGIVLAQLIRPEVAFAKVLVGLFVCFMLYLSARQAGWRRYLTATRNHPRTKYLSNLGLPLNWTQPFISPARTFRLMAILLIGVTTFSLAQTYPMPAIEQFSPASSEPTSSALSFTLSLAVYWLSLSGLLIVLLTDEPLKTGQGLLCMLMGFELWYSILESSLLLVGIWGGVNLLLALVIGYLTTVRSVILEEDF